MRRRIAGMLIVLLSALGASGTDSFKVVVNKANPASSMTKAEVSRLFLKKTTRWPNGETVEPVDLPEGSVSREAFSNQILGKATSSVVAFWHQQIFAGHEVPPMTKESEPAVIAFVRQNVNAIGYVSPGAATSDVKVIEVK